MNSRYQMNGIPLSDRSGRLLTAPISELMKREREKREFNRKLYAGYFMPIVRKEHTLGMNLVTA